MLMSFCCRCQYQQYQRENSLTCCRAQRSLKQIATHLERTPRVALRFDGVFLRGLRPSLRRPGFAIDDAAHLRIGRVCRTRSCCQQRLREGGQSRSRKAQRTGLSTTAQHYKVISLFIKEGEPPAPSSHISGEGAHKEHCNSWGEEKRCLLPEK